MNGIKEGETNDGEDLLPGRCTTEQQSGSGRHCTTAKGESGSRKKEKVVSRS